MPTKEVNKPAIVTVYVDEEDRERIRIAAFERRMSPSKYMRGIIREALDRREQEQQQQATS